MPAFCTHYILASEEMSNLHRIAAESGFKLCENAVYIGSQGPDISFSPNVSLAKGKAASRRRLCDAPCKVRRYS